jgi:ADP-ribose pyrophosphatase YjhB (NUDIX family)
MAERDSLISSVVEAVEQALRRRVSERTLRRAYRLGYLTLKPVWFVTRPRTHGMKCVLRSGDHVLLVRHTYARRDKWDLPGGFLRAGEELQAAVARELREELGVAPGRTVHVTTVPARFDHRRETIDVVAVDVPEGTVLTPSPVEIATTRWARHDALPPAMTTFSRRMVARAYWDEFR